MADVNGWKLTFTWRGTGTVGHVDLPLDFDVEELPDLIREALREVEGWLILKNREGDDVFLNLADFVMMKPEPVEPDQLDALHAALTPAAAPENLNVQRGGE